MATDKTPTHGERIEALEKETFGLRKEVTDLTGVTDAIKEALASGDPTLIAQAFAK